MRIAHTTPYFHPEYYGSHEAFLSAELAARGHEVHLFTSDRMPLWGGAKGIDERLPLGESEWRGVRIVRVPAGPTVSFVPSLPSLPNHLRKQDYDLFLSHEVFSIVAWHTARAARRNASPFLLVQHGYSAGRRPLLKLLFQLEFRTLGRRVMQSADALVTLTGAGAQFLTGLGARPERVHVVPTGVDCELFQPRPEASNTGTRFGFLGRVEREKGVFLLLDAFREACARSTARSPRLVFAGVGDDLQELRERAAALGLADQVEFTGRLPHANVPDYLAGLHALVAPTLITEPFGIVAVEAAAAGIPVFASRIGGLAETVEDQVTGLVLPAGELVALTDALVRGLDDPTWLAELGQSGRERALSTYDWPVITDRFEALFASIAQKESTSSRPKYGVGSISEALDVPPALGSMVNSRHKVTPPSRRS